jgi:hypothetical protein
MNFARRASDATGTLRSLNELHRMQSFDERRESIGPGGLPEVIEPASTNLNHAA